MLNSTHACPHCHTQFCSLLVVETSHTPDAEMSGWQTICSALSSCSIQTLNISDIGMGPKGAVTLGEMLSSGEDGEKLIAAMSFFDVSGNLVF